METDGGALERAIVRAAKAEESANQAHHRLDQADSEIAGLRQDIKDTRHTLRNEIAAVRLSVSQVALDVKGLLVKMGLVGMLLLAVLTFVSGVLVKVLFP